MLARLILVAVSSAVLSAAAACSSQSRGDLVGLVPGSGSIVGAAVVAADADIPRRWPTDPIEIVSAEVRGDSLHLVARHGGGCAEHRYALVVGTRWAESMPVQATATLAHDANGDPCRALLSPSMAFSLLPVRDAYRRAYGTQTGAIALTLQPSTIGVVYRF